VKVLVALLVLLVGLGLLLDRLAVDAAEGQVATQLAAEGDLAGPPDVEIRGFPFLTQALGGRYDEVRISLSAEQLGRPAGTEADVVLRGVRLPLSALLGGTVRALPVERIDGRATLSYDLLEQELGGDTTLQPEGDGLRITRTVDLFGYTLPLTAAGTVALDGDTVVVDVREASGAGVSIPGFLVDRATDLLDLRYPVELPFGLRVTGVAPAADGIRVRVEARDAVLQAE
jgi:hypothetical protein